MLGSRVGKWTGDDFSVTIGASTGNRYYASLPQLHQFAHAVAKLIAARLARSATTMNAKPSVFVLGSAPRATLPMKRQPTLSSGGVEVAGCAWFGPESLSTSTGIALPGDDADENFRFIDADLGSGKAIAIYF